MSDSRVRDHLANERTYLAWVRSSIALMGLGVVIAKLRFLFAAMPGVGTPGPGAGTRSTLLGLLFAGAGLLTLAFAAANYARTRRMIETNNFRPLGVTLVAYTAIIFILGAVSILYLLTLR